MWSKIYAQRFLFLKIIFFFCHVMNFSLSAFVFLIAVGVKKTDCLPRYSLPLLLQHPHHSPVPVSPVHHFNFVSNGHPYKITVNNKVCSFYFPRKNGCLKCLKLKFSFFFIYSIVHSYQFTSSFIIDDFSILNNCKCKWEVSNFVLLERCLSFRCDSISIKREFSTLLVYILW